MADVYDFIAEQGLITTDAGAILEDVSSEYKNTFGQDLVVPDSTNLQGSSTPQGLLIVTETLARIAVADNNAAVANQINPNIAGGIFLDAICALTGLQRTPATYSTTTAVFTGVAGTSIPAGSQAQTADGNVFATTQVYTIPTGGTLANVSMKAIVSGSIGCDANALTAGEGGSIVSDVLGWETIQSNTAAVLGTSTQSDVALRTTRINTLAGQGASVAEAIISGVTKVDGVSSMTFLENPTGSTATFPTGDPDGVSMIAHSIYACVDGGTDLDVAQALVSKKSAGAAYNNSVVASLSGTTTTSSATILMASTTGVEVGQSVQGVGIPANATVVSIVVNTSIVISIAATASATVMLTFSQGIAVSQNVTVPYSNQIMTVLFDRPTPIQILVDITVKINTPVQDPEEAVKEAILLYASGGISGMKGLVVGQSVSAFEISGAVTIIYPGIYVSECLVSIYPTSPTSSDEIPIEVYQIASITSSNIAVHIS